MIKRKIDRYLAVFLYLLVKIRYGKEQDKRHSSDVNAAYHIYLIFF